MTSLVTVGTFLYVFVLVSLVNSQREWVQWGPLRVYVVGRGRNGNLQQLRDEREVNSVQDILAQLDTAKIENTTLPLPLISITLPKTNEAITLDCITANNEPGQCKMVQNCFVNAFTREGRIKNRALLEADVESSVSCNQTLPLYNNHNNNNNNNNSGEQEDIYNKTFDIREKLICCEKPKVLDFMKVVNITDVSMKSGQIILENMTVPMLSMLEMESAVPTLMAQMDPDSMPNMTMTIPIPQSIVHAMNLTGRSGSVDDPEMGEPLPNFEALIAPLMPQFMKVQQHKPSTNSIPKSTSLLTPLPVVPSHHHIHNNNNNNTDSLGETNAEDPVEMEESITMTPEVMRMPMTTNTPASEALIMPAPQIITPTSTFYNNNDNGYLPTSIPHDHSLEISNLQLPHHHEPGQGVSSKNISSVIAHDQEIHGNTNSNNNNNNIGSKSNFTASSSSAIIKKHAPHKLCIIKPHLQCAARRVGNYRRPETISLRNKYSWMATLFVDRQMFCMGSLIDHEHILTAAHCFPKNPSSMDFEKVKVGIGYNSDRPNITAPFVTRKVSRIIIHEGFNFKTLLNDIAIVKLESPAFNKTTLFDYDDVVDQDFPDPQPKPICFSESSEEFSTSFENQEAILSGWTIPRRRRKTMAQEISIRVWNNEECCAKYGDIPPGGITDEMMCAFTYGKNDCFSRYNTGAPLFVITEKGKRINAHNHTTPNYIVDRYDGDDEGEYVQFQIGILSWGYGCKDYPPVFTRVNEFLPWIERNIVN